MACLLALLTGFFPRARAESADVEEEREHDPENHPMPSTPSNGAQKSA